MSALFADPTPWQLLPLTPPAADDRVLAEIVDGGQAFRWHRQEDGTWLGQWSDCIAHIRWHPSGLEWRSPSRLAARVGSAIGPYFGAGANESAAVDRLPWRSDPHLLTCLQHFRGLRILRQPFGETLLGFLCSATKQIVQIKQMLALLAARHGAPLNIDDPFRGNSGPAFHALPTWTHLATLSESDLRGCLLGFRARYIHETARFLAGHPGWLEETEHLPYSAARARLAELPGVGEKVADCVLLFGGGRLEAFPVDVWILKTLARRYGLSGWKPAQLAQFGRVHFGSAAGLAQQYLFAFERAQPRAGR